MDLYDLLNKIISPHDRRLSSHAFSEEKKNLLDNSEDKELFVLLQNIASMGTKYENGEIRFLPMFQLADGRRTFSIEDLTDDDYQLLHSLNISKLPLLLRARIAEILWRKEHDYKMALIASSSNFALYHTLFDSEHWSTCYRYLEQSVTLAAKVNAPNHSAYLQAVYDDIIKLNGEDTSYLSISLIDLLLANKIWMVFDPILTIVDKIILSSSNMNRTIRAYNLKAAIYTRQGKQSLATESRIRLANFLESTALSEPRDNIPALFNAQNYLQQAIQLFRSNGAPDDGRRAHKELLEIQKIIPQYMIPISVSKDVTKEYNEIQSLFNDLSFKEHIAMITEITPLLKTADLKKEVIEEASSSLSMLFSESIISASGQTILDIPPIDINDPEADNSALEQHMHRLASEKEEVYGGVLKWAEDILRENFSFSRDDFNFLVVNNPIIPKGRENIIKSGIYYGAIGELFVALHILAPQIENLFRYIAEISGAITTTINNKNTSDAKLLSSVFDTPELKDCYNTDILFLFKGLLNEKAGANIRNNIAHGLMSEATGNSGVARFFFWWVVKLLSFTSYECQKILVSEKILNRVNQSKL